MIARSYVALVGVVQSLEEVCLAQRSEKAGIEQLLPYKLEVLPAQE